jgi:hypothetical protein
LYKKLNKQNYEKIYEILGNLLSNSISISFIPVLSHTLVYRKSVRRNICRYLGALYIIRLSSYKTKKK